MGKRLRCLREVITIVPSIYRRQDSHLPLGPCLFGPQASGEGARICGARAPSCQSSPGNGVEDSLGEPSHDSSDCRPGQSRE